MDIFVARQPIFDKNKEIFGYELLYRKNGKNNYFEEINADEATSNTIINSFLVIGLKKLTKNSKAFINFSANLIKQEVMTVLPKENVVIEILEDVIVDKNLIKACKNLKDKGYIITLDDFVFENINNPLIEFADIIKVDFKKTTHEEQREIVNKFAGKNIKFLAEKVETYEDFDRAFEYGYSYFQGYFFSKPVIISGKDISPSKLIYIELIRKISETEPDFAKISQVIEKDVSLTYELLKLVNSAAFSHGKIKSINHAISIIGINEIKKWVYLIALKNLKDNKPSEIINLALIRAEFCEIAAEKIDMKDRAAELFTWYLTPRLLFN
jgi:c-di-GMP-related signal transduction protein